MLRLFKFLKPSKLFIILCILLVAVMAFSALFLPDRMSVIIGEGITSEYEFEYTEDEEPIYIALDDIKIPLPKFKYEDAGELVIEKGSDGDYYVYMEFISNTDFYVPEKDDNGEIIYIPIPMEEEIILVPMPIFIRTVDGQLDSERQQGKLILDDSGAPVISSKQVSHLDIIIKNGLIMIAITLVSSIAGILVAYFSAKIAMRFGRDLRSKLFKKTVYFSQEEEDNFGSASLITRMTNDVMQIQNLVVMMFRMMAMVPIMFIGGLIMAFSKDAKMSLVLFISAPVVLVVVIIVATKIIPLFKRMQKRIDNLTLVSRENITGVRVIRAFNQDERENKRFRYANLQVTNLSIKVGRIMSVLFPLMQLVMSVTAVGVIFVAINTINSALSSGGMNFQVLGNMMAVVQYMMQIMMSIIMVAVLFIMVPRASVSASRINEVLDTVNKIKEPTDPIKNNEIQGTLEFDNVEFSYPNASKSVLQDITFDIKKGETAAIIGSTGSGKSTLINLIPRLYDVTNGTIKIDGLDIKDYSLEDLRARIGFVSQNAILFEGTIRDNISYGYPQASEEEIQEAARISQAEEFINESPEKYDYWVEQGGANLSGGQKQRLAIARAVCRKPSLYVFDDSFSALDFRTDKRLRKELKKVTQDSSVLIIGQRIGSIMDADKIIVMQNGKIVGIGKHRDLLKNCEVYKEIAISQMSQDELLRDNIGLVGGEA